MVFSVILLGVLLNMEVVCFIMPELELGTMVDVSVVVIVVVLLVEFKLGTIVGGDGGDGEMVMVVFVMALFFLSCVFMVTIIFMVVILPR